jgi:hypothetical protein
LIFMPNPPRRWTIRWVTTSVRSKLRSANPGGYLYSEHDGYVERGGSWMPGDRISLLPFLRDLWRYVNISQIAPRVICAFSCAHNTRRMSISYDKSNLRHSHKLITSCVM